MRATGRWSTELTQFNIDRSIRSKEGVTSCCCVVVVLINE